MVRKDDLLKHVSEQARLEAQKPKLDEFATEDLIQEAADIVGDLFSAITWETVEGDVIKSTDPVTPWRGSLEDSYPPTANGHAGFLVIRVNPFRISLISFLPHGKQISPDKNVNFPCTTATFTLPPKPAGFVVLCQLAQGLRVKIS